MILLESRGRLVGAPRCKGQGQNQEKRNGNDEGEGRHDLVVSPEVDPSDVAEVGDPKQPVGDQGDASSSLRTAHETPAIDVPKCLPGIDNSPDGEGPTSRGDVQEVLVRDVASQSFESQRCLRCQGVDDNGSEVHEGGECKANELGNFEERIATCFGHVLSVDRAAAEVRLPIDQRSADGSSRFYRSSI